MSFQSLTLEEAETLALKILKQVMEEKITSDNVDIGAVSVKTGRFRIYSTEELQRIISRLD